MRSSLKFIITLTALAIAAALFWFLIYDHRFDSEYSYSAKVIIRNNVEFKIEAVDSPDELARGLSGRTGLAKDGGMYFIFERPGIYGFWMKDMKFAIDIIWINGNKIIGFEKNISPESYPKVFYPASEVDSVLEVSAGTAEKFKFMAGDAIKML